MNTNNATASKTILSTTAIAALFGLSVLTASIANAAPPEYAPQDFSNTVITAQSNSRSNSTETFARGRILVMPRAGLPAQAFKNILREHGGKARKVGQSDIYIVDVPEFAEEAVVMALSHNPHIKFAELDYRFTPAMIPNDTYFPNAWHHPKIGTPTAWDISQGAGITIAILDTGVDATHPDLAANIVPGWNFYDNNADTSDVYGHGTRVSGAAAAANNNSTGVTSVAGLAKIMPIRVTDVSGGGWTSAIADGLIWIADQGVRVANISLTAAGSTIVQTAAQYMKDKGGLVTVGAGNNGMESTIAPTTSFIVVSATDQNDVKASYATYGNFVALAAPGNSIWTTWSPAYYDTAAGTSISNPVAAGTIALMMSANPKLSSYDIESLLFSTAVDLGDPGRDKVYGYGRVDAAAAVLAAKNATPTVDSTAPNVAIANPLEGATVSGLIPVDVDAQDNVSVSRVEFWVNNTNVATDTASPFAFSWDTTGATNGTAQIEARAYDAAGNVATSTIAVSVSNSTPSVTNDTQAPALIIANPVAGSVTGTVNISTSATDNSGSAGITQTIYVDGAAVATGSGSTVSYSWNTRSKKVKAGSHSIQAIAKDAAGNATSTSVTVNVIK